MLTDPGRTLLARWIYVMVKRDDAFVVPYTPARWQRVTEPAAGYGPAFEPFLERVCETLAGADWAVGNYYPGGWFRALEGRGEDPAAAPVTPETLAPFHLDELRVDAQGQWWVGPKRIAGRVLQHFLRHLEFDAELGRYRVHYRMDTTYETRYLHHESPPIRVHRLALEDGTPVVQLNTGAREPLRPDSLRMDAAEHLYCAVGEAGLAAWFEDPPRWELLKDAEPRNGDWVLRVGGRELVVPLGAPWPYADAPGQGTGAP